MLTVDKKLEIEQTVNETIKFVTRNSRSLMHPEFSEYFNIYTFTTENLAAYISKLHIKNKKVLTVTASGDQLINLALNGAKEVDNYDLNKNAYYFVQLKVAALKTLSYDEFLNFFCSSDDKHTNYFSRELIGKNNNVFDYKIYEKIRPNLSQDVAYYWDFLYNNFANDGSKLCSTVCYSTDKKSAIYLNDYLKNPVKYKEAKKAITDFNFNFYSMDIFDLHKLQKKYDCILLSNIYDNLVGDFYQVVSEEEFNNYISDKLSSVLNYNGIIQLAYQYHYKTKNACYGSILKKLFLNKYSLEKRESLDKFSNKKILVPCIVKEYRNNNDKDCIYLYSSGKCK